jgi:hypothetical protein
MTQFLDTLEKMKGMQIVRFFSQFFSEERLSPIFNQMKARAASGTVGGLAKELVVWAIVLALGAFIIDQIFYWTNPGQVEQAKGTWRSFSAGVADLGVSARTLFERARGIGRKKELPGGRR